MRKRFGSVVVLGALAVMGFARPAAAQIGGGVSFLTNNGTGAGFAVNAARDMWTRGSMTFAPTGDFSFHSKDETHAFTYGGGIRANFHTMNARNILPFGEFLLGGSNIGAGCEGCDDDNAFQLTYGGGVHIPMSAKWNLLAQLDIITYLRESATDSAIRWTFGASVPWK